MRICPEIALFKPLDSLARSAVFAAVPALGATAVFAWLARRNTDPVQSFLKIAAVVPVLSIIPDYLLPVEHKTILASSVTASLHVVAAAVTVPSLPLSLATSGRPASGNPEGCREGSCDIANARINASTTAAGARLD